MSYSLRPDFRRYGDRAPRSFLGRMFCIIWIVTGMSIVAIFTAMVTASLSASIQYRFVIHGSVVSVVLRWIFELTFTSTMALSFTIFISTIHPVVFSMFIMFFSIFTLHCHRIHLREYLLYSSPCSLYATYTVIFIMLVAIYIHYNLLYIHHIRKYHYYYCSLLVHSQGITKVLFNHNFVK